MPIWITQLTLVGLGEWDDKGNFVPELGAEVPSAENGGVSADGLTITWKLKPCLFWSDGEPLTSADVKFTWESVMDPDNVPIQKTGYDKIASIDTPDDTTVVIKFKELYPALADRLHPGPEQQRFDPAQAHSRRQDRSREGSVHSLADHFFRSVRHY